MTVDPVVSAWVPMRSQGSLIVAVRTIGSLLLAALAILVLLPAALSAQAALAL